MIPLYIFEAKGLELTPAENYTNKKQLETPTLCIIHEDNGI